MTDRGKSLQPVYNIHFHALQEGDKTDVRVEENSETNFINSSVNQVNIGKQEASNDDEQGRPKVEVQLGETSHQEPDNSTPALTSPVSPPYRKKRKLSSDQGKKAKKSFMKKERELQTPKNIIRETSTSDLKNLIEEKGEAKSEERSSVAKGNESSTLIRCEMLKVRVIVLCGQSMFHEASSCLEQLTSILDGNLDVTTLLLMTECSLQLGREIDAKKAFDELKHALMMSPSNLDDVEKLVADDNSNVRALVLLRIASDMYVSLMFPTNAIEKIYYCVQRMQKHVGDMIELGDRQKTIAIDFGLFHMEAMANTLRDAKNADPANKAKIEGQWVQCLNWIGCNYFSAKKYEKSTTFHKRGIETMKRNFGENCSKYQLYGHLLNNLGSSNDSLGKYTTAAEYYTEAIAAYTDASDFSYEKEKEMFLETTQNNLKNTHKKT